MGNDSDVIIRDVDKISAIQLSGVEIMIRYV